MMRRRAVQRLTSALIGASVAAIGAVALAALDGRELDFELIWIIALGVAGAWLLLTAIMASVKRPAPKAQRYPDALGVPLNNVAPLGDPAPVDDAAPLGDAAPVDDAAPLGDAAPARDLAHDEPVAVAPAKPRTRKKAASPIEEGEGA